MIQTRAIPIGTVSDPPPVLAVRAWRRISGGRCDEYCVFIHNGAVYCMDRDATSVRKVEQNCHGGIVGYYDASIKAFHISEDLYEVMGDI